MLGLDDVKGMVRSQLGGSLRRGLVISRDTRLDQLGLSSLQVSDIIFEIEDQLGIEFDTDELVDVITTVGDLVDHANAAKAAVAG